MKKENLIVFKYFGVIKQKKLKVLFTKLQDYDRRRKGVR